MEEQMMGLAGSQVQPGPAQQGPSEEEMVQRVAEMLMQGVTIEELIQMGVPQQVIEMAMQMLEAQSEATDTAPTPPVQQNMGLAGSSL